MEEEKAGTSTRKPPSDSHIPPPTDPYITYQTPYPRKSSDEVQNPFVEFRRLADAAFSSFFSNLPRILGTERLKEANIRESDQEFVKAFDEHAKKFENQIAEMVRARTEEAEGLRKKLEQDWEERRRENEKRMEEENQRWEMMRRGLERCPGLRPDGLHARAEPDTELDLYDGLKAYESVAYKPKAEQHKSESKKCPWKDEHIEKMCPWNAGERQGQRGWLTGLGWDGRRRAKNIPLYAPCVQDSKQAQETNVDWQLYRDEEMDPFNNDDHLVPWLKLSPYSPISLISDQFWGELTSQTRTNESDNALYDLPWDEAFEDLMSVHKVGKLPNLARRLVYWGGPNQWMTDMALRGSLGSKWNEGFMVAALMHSVESNHWRGFDGIKEQCRELTGKEFQNTIREFVQAENNVQDDREEEGEDDHDDNDDDNGDEELHELGKIFKDAFDPRLERGYEQIEQLAQSVFGSERPIEKVFGAHGMQWPSPEAVFEALAEGRYRAEKEQTRANEDKVNHEESSTLSRSSWPSAAVLTPSNIPAKETKSESIVSTFSTTTTRVLPDGTTEIKRVLKKRFADGREESSETTESRPAQANCVNDSSTQTDAEVKQKKQAGRNGWFWN